MTEDVFLETVDVLHYLGYENVLELRVVLDHFNLLLKVVYYFEDVVDCGGDG